MTHYVKTHKDGTTETLVPHQYRGGGYKVEIDVPDLASVEDWVRKGARVRMSGSRTTAPSVVPASRKTK